MYAAVAELADALDSKSSGAIRAGSSPASGIRKSSLVVGRRAFCLYFIQNSCQILLNMAASSKASKIYLSAF